MVKSRWVPQGNPVEVFPSEIDRIPEYSPVFRTHLWIVTSVYQVDPAQWSAVNKPILDQENLIALVGPGCYYCERIYRVAKNTPCRGVPD